MLRTIRMYLSAATALLGLAMVLITLAGKPLADAPIGLIFGIALLGIGSVRLALYGRMK